MTAQLDLVLRDGDRLAEGDPHLLAHEVDAGDHLGHRVLDLDARVHLHEEVVAVRGQQTLDRPGRAVARRARRVDADRADARAELVVHRRGRRLLDELLMAALDGAVALAQVDDVAVRVGEYLHLDVPRIDDQLLDVHVGIGEVRLPLPPRRLEGPGGAVRRLDDLHALAAAARGRLDQQRIADRLAELEQLLDRDNRVGRAGDDRDARVLHRPTRPRLLAHQLDRGRRRTDPDEPRVLDRAREGRVLGEEAVARMHGAGAGALRRLHETLDVQIALRRRRRADQVRLVGEGDVQRAAVGLGVDGHRAESELTQRPEHADGDLTAVGHENLVEHHPYSLH